MTDPSRRAALAAFASAALLAAAPVGAQPASGVGAVTPQQFGARGDGRADDAAAFQAAADSGRPIAVPPGRYRITRPVELAAGQSIAGPAGGGAGDHVAAIVNDVPGSGCLWYTRDIDVIRRDMPTIANLSLTADHPIRFNDPETGRVAEGRGSNIPYGVRPAVLNCTITAREAGQGIGIAWTKMFDGLIEGCEITGFAINLLLLGCDLNAVRRNRLVLAHRHHILELSAGTFGSQNLLEHNDLLQAGSAACIFVKTTARHARIRDNYLEHGFTGAADGDVRAFAGFIDASAVDAPRIGSNAPGERFTAVIRDNRIDGTQFVRAFVYRYQPEGQTWGEIVDPGTTGPGVPEGGRMLRLVDAAGRDIDRVPFVFNAFNAAAFHFASPSFGRWNGYRTSAVAERRIDGRNLAMFGAATLSGNHADAYLAARGATILLLPGYAGQAALTFDPDVVLGPGAWTAEIIARAAGAETLTVGRWEGETAGSPVAFPLTPGFRRFVLPLDFGPGARRRGVYLQRGGGDATIEIESITFAPR